MLVKVKIKDIKKGDTIPGLWTALEDWATGTGSQLTVADCRDLSTRKLVWASCYLEITVERLVQEPEILEWSYYAPHGHNSSWLAKTKKHSHKIAVDCNGLFNVYAGEMIIGSTNTLTQAKSISAKYDKDSPC